jgi:aryl-alcohol dehydrogenase-like predicted oxidoreductase
MILKPLGATGVEISAIGLGTGDYFWDDPMDNTQKVRLLQLGLNQGINWLDTAEGYGNGKSEEIVGEATKGAREKVVLATKLSTEHHARTDVLAAAEGSLRRLSTDYIDIYQVHWPNPSVPITETMESLRVLLESGKVRFVGLCNFTRPGLAEAQEALGEHRIVSLQNEYNLFERTIEYTGLLSYCADNSVTPLAYSPLDQGRLTSMSPDKLDLLTAMAGAHGRTVAQVVLGWLVSGHGMVAIVRSTKERHIMDNAASTDFELSEDEIQAIDRAFSEEMIYTPTDRIRVSVNGEWNNPVYQTLAEALENEHGLAPSPLELSRSMKDGELLKPVRLIPSTEKGYDYDLIGGRIRYWAWVIAHEGKTPIPAYVRNEIG